MYNPEDMPSEIVIGNLGDNDATEVEFDCTEWFQKYPGGDVGATYVPSCGTTVYEFPADRITVDGNIVRLLIGRDMTRVVGEGSLVLSLKKGEDIEKRSKLTKTKVGAGHHFL